jgi:hypothetical protein
MHKLPQTRLLLLTLLPSNHLSFRVPFFGARNLLSRRFQAAAVPCAPNDNRAADVTTLSTVKRFKGQCLI